MTFFSLPNFEHFDSDNMETSKLTTKYIILLDKLIALFFERLIIQL